MKKIIDLWNIYSNKNEIIIKMDKKSNAYNICKELFYSGIILFFEELTISVRDSSEGEVADLLININDELIDYMKKTIEGSLQKEVKNEKNKKRKN